MISELTRTSLQRYAPEDPREAAFLERLLRLLDAPEPCSRDLFTPGHLTASAFVLSPERDSLLLIFHKKLGIWVQPGGHVEPGDASLFDAARREVAEEVGVMIPADAAAPVFDVDIHAIPARQADPAHEHFDVRYCVVAPSREFVIGDEVADARWFELSALTEGIVDESVLRAVRKLSGR